MKKLITLILALVTVMTSLTACGNSAPAKTEDEDDDDRIVTHAPASNGTDSTASIFVPDSLPATDTEAPKPEPFLLAGTWKEIPTDAASDPESFTITDSGELNTKTLKGGKLTTDKDKIEFTDNMSLSFKFNKLVMTYYFKLVDGKYVAYTEGTSNRYYYYREADFADYEAVTLTKENAAQYIEGCNAFTFKKDAFGEVSEVYVYDHLRFKEGVGAPSWIYGEFNYESMFVEGVLDTADGSFTQGAEVAARISHDFIKKVSVSGAGDYIVQQFGFSTEFEKLDGTKVKIKKVDVENFLSAEKVVGVVFVKKS